jgi:DNA-binding sugar fermentation-stimulating protein
VVSRRHLEALADEAEAAGESAFTYGRLHAREQSSAAELDRRFARVWERASRPKLRAWLR